MHLVAWTNIRATLKQINPVMQDKSELITCYISGGKPFSVRVSHILKGSQASERHEELDKGKLRAIVAAIRPHVANCDEARRCLHYFWANRKRMRYPRFHAQGLCTSTGVVEAGCKVAVGTRLKRSGMHWTVRGANAIIALRCSKLSGRFQDFWERRSDRRAA